MSVLGGIAQWSVTLPATLQSLDPVVQALIVCAVLLILSAIPATARFAIYAGLAILFLQLIHQSS